MKRIIALFLALVFIAALIPAAVLAEDEKPDGWWPVLDAYNQAVASGNVDAIMSAGDALIEVYSTVRLNGFTANQFYMVYLKRMELEVFEKRSDYDAAAENTGKLLEMSEYLTSIGVDRTDMEITCRTHLKAIEPKYGVYALAGGEVLPAAKGVPKYGTLYGAISGSETLSHKGITSFYVELEEQSARSFEGLISPFADGSRAILINYNFKGEGDAARAIPGGKYDSLIDDSLSFIGTLSCPVLLRIGGEMNVWTNTVAPGDFIKAYEYIAVKARKLCPKVSLVWSPNYVSAWGVDMADFYPADKYVDWVGVSLYYKYSVPEKITSWVEWAHQGRFADPVICAEEVISVARAHKKPVIVTEGGAAHNTGDAAQEKWAAAKVAKALSTLDMVFPEVRAILFFDREINGNDYTISGAVRTAANAAIAANGALLGSLDDEAGTWVELGSPDAAATGTLTLGAAGHTYKSADMSATYVLDGTTVAAPKGAPNLCKLDLAKLSVGPHKLAVTLTDGAGYSATLEYSISFDGETVRFGRRGDVNGDSRVNAKDVTTIMKTLVGQAVAKYIESAADFNGDGKVNAKDVVAIMKAIIAG